MATRAAGKVALDEALEAARGLHAEDFLRAQAAPEQTVTAALCAATDGLSPFDRKFSSPTRAQTAALLQKSAE